MEAAQHLTNSCTYQLQPLGLHRYKQRTQLTVLLAVSCNHWRCMQTA